MNLPLLLFVLILCTVLLLLNTTINAAARRMFNRVRGTSAAKQKVDLVQDGEPIEATYTPRKQARKPDRSRWLALPFRSVLLTALALLIIVSIFALPRSLLAPRNQFLTVVVPFTEQNGTSTNAGTAAARELVAELKRTGNAAEALSRTPQTTSEALEQMRQEGADALIMGTISSGGLLDQPSLTPLLIYQPTGAFAPASWQGYAGRFAMPQAYTLSAQPINGKVVLPLVVRALARYGQGDYDGAFGDLSTLLNDYPEVAQPLPRALRGNILWASGKYEAAIDEYQRTGVMAMARDQPSEMALLANNLGAIYQDAGNPASGSAFEQAQALLDSRILAATQVNRARALVASQQNEQAIALLAPLRNDESSHALLATLADAYLGTRRFKDAEAVMQQAELQVDRNAQQTTATYTDLVTKRLKIDNDERRIRLTLDQALDTGENLLWELLTGEALDRETIAPQRNELTRLVEQTAANERDWQRMAAAADVEQQPYRSQIANEQARRSASVDYEQRKLLAALDLDLSRERSTTERTILGLISTVRGQGTASNPTQAEIEALWKLNPNDSEVGVLRGFAALATGQPELAKTQLELVDREAANRPEPVYGLAQIALAAPTPNREQAKALLNEAITRDPAFYPARSQLARLAEQENDWPAAIVQRRWLVERRNSPADVLALAKAYQSSGPAGYAAAENALLPLANEQQLSAIIQLSDLYITAGNIPAAQAALERARTDAPKNAQLAYKLGNVYVRLNRASDARQQYEEAITLDPASPQARVELGKIYAANGQIDRAAEQYAAALRSGTDDVDALRDIGDVLLIAGEQKQALDAYQKAIKKAPDDARLRLGLANVYLALNQPKDAAREAEQAVALAGGRNPSALVVLGNVSLALGDTKGATEHFTQANQQDPQLSAALLGLGRGAAADNNWAYAETYFNQAISVDPQSAEAYYWKGEALLQANNLANARNAYANALTLRANYPEAQYGLAKAEAATGNFAEAHAAVQRALALRRSYAEAHILDGLIYEQQNQRDDARRAYSRAIDIDRRSAEGFYRRALLTVGDGNLIDARGDLEAAVQIRDGFAEAHYWLGRSYLADDRTDKANQQFNRALELSPNGNYPEAQFYQGVARERLGDRASAFVAYRAALEQGKGSQWASEAQAALTRLGQ